MNLELGKIYETRAGHIITIVDVDFKRSRPYHGTIMNGKEVIRVASFYSNGMYTDYPTEFDIVKEKL